MLSLFCLGLYHHFSHAELKILTSLRNCHSWPQLPGESALSCFLPVEFSLYQGMQIAHLPGSSSGLGHLSVLSSDMDNS